MTNNKDINNNKPKKLVEQTTNTLIFNNKNILQKKQIRNNTFNFNKNTTQKQNIKFNFDKSLTKNKTGIKTSTQYNSNSNITRTDQDNASTTTLTSLSFNNSGILTAVYDNDKSREVAQITLAKFENNEALFKVGKNLFKESRRSGQPTMGKPGESGRGEVLSKSLELSNVDIANEFVGLMQAQRNFSANAKTLQTSDQMLQEVLNIKR